MRARKVVAPSSPLVDIGGGPARSSEVRGAKVVWKLLGFRALRLDLRSESGFL